LNGIFNILIRIKDFDN